MYVASRRSLKKNPLLCISLEVLGSDDLWINLCLISCKGGQGTHYGSTGNVCIKNSYQLTNAPNFLLVAIQ